MQVSKWGNSLAVRLPKDVVERMGLKAGDDLDVMVLSGRTFQVHRRLSREEALKRLWETRIPLPPGFKFDREEANER